MFKGLNQLSQQGITKWNQQSRVVRVLSVLVVMLAMLCIWLMRQQAKATEQAEFAQEQIRIFNELSNRALVGNPAQSAEYLRRVVTYYPSGTKLESGSPLDQIVELQRQRAIQEIITMLRVRTRDDLGRAPEPWIKKYGAVGK